VSEVVIVRHGATQWSREGRHTGRTDVPLDDAGRRAARGLRAVLSRRTFAAVFTSPLSRAVDTCALAGFDGVRLDDLQEWDYGDYEGRTTADIRAERPDWSLWRDGCPHGESPADVGARADRVVAAVRAIDGDVVLFAHGHLLRVLTARWLGLPPLDGALFALETAAIGVLGYERETPVIRTWSCGSAP
jgi:probable phosphoglycerate mutase